MALGRALTQKNKNKNKRETERERHRAETRQKLQEALEVTLK